MNKTQKNVAVSAFLIQAFLMNTVFCNWEFGSKHQRLAEISRTRMPDTSGLILPLGLAGVYSRNHSKTHDFDTILGLLIPVAFLSAAAFLYTSKSVSTPDNKNEA